MNIYVSTFLDNDDETAASRDSWLSPDDDQTINPGKPDLLALLKDIISPLISWQIKRGGSELLAMCYLA